MVHFVNYKSQIFIISDNLILPVLPHELGAELAGEHGLGLVESDGGGAAAVVRAEDGDADVGLAGHALCRAVELDGAVHGQQVHPVLRRVVGLEQRLQIFFTMLQIFFSSFPGV